MIVDRTRALWDVIDMAQKAAERGLVVSTSGNVSVRLDARLFAVSCSGASLRDLERRHLATCEIEDPGTVLGPAASLETPFHRAIYRARPDVGAVLHCQSPYATALACAEVLDRVDLNFIPEAPAYLGTPAIIAYRTPGSEALSDAVGEAFAAPERRVALLRNHGQIAVGPTPAEALRRAEFLEFACRVAAIGGTLRRLDAAAIADLERYGSR